MTQLALADRRRSERQLQFRAPGVSPVPAHHRARQHCRPLLHHVSFLRGSGGGKFITTSTESPFKRNKSLAKAPNRPSTTPLTGL